jgi:predicted nucleic acid-binding protein
MPAKHNITVAIEPVLLKKARAVAAQRGQSVSALLADKLRELVRSDAHYSAARKRARLSVQVLQEFYVNVTKKLATPIARQTAREIIATYGAWVHQTTTPETVTRAIDIATMSQLQFWDALIVASAEQADSEYLFSEDLNEGQVIAGVTVVNPFFNR